MGYLMIVEGPNIFHHYYSILWSAKHFVTHGYWWISDIKEQYVIHYHYLLKEPCLLSITKL